MEETHVLFQTIKLGDSGRIMSAPASEYFPELLNFEGIPLADVLPFHIIGGHVTTNLSNEDFQLLAVSLDGNKQSKPVIMDFKVSVPSPDTWSFFKLNYVVLKPIMHGYYMGFGRRQAIESEFDLEDATHLYLISKGGGPIYTKINSNDSVTMTLIISRDTSRPNKKLPIK